MQMVYAKKTNKIKNRIAALYMDERTRKQTHFLAQLKFNITKKKWWMFVLSAQIHCTREQENLIIS